MKTDYLSDIQKCEHIVNVIKSIEPEPLIATHLHHLMIFVSGIANDRVDARELADERLIIIGQQSQVIHSLQQLIVDILAVCDDMGSPAWVRLNTIKESLRSPTK